jgi:hypothetical protein
MRFMVVDLDGMAAGTNSRRAGAGAEDLEGGRMHRPAIEAGSVRAIPYTEAAPFFPEVDE